jgi:hypothetical protein
LGIQELRIRWWIGGDLLLKSRARDVVDCADPNSDPLGCAAINRVSTPLVAIAKFGPISVSVDALVASFVTSCQRAMTTGHTFPDQRTNVQH